MRRRHLLPVILAAIALTTSPSLAVDLAAEGTMAWFEDGWIDLSADWGDAQACLISNESICFRTEAELDTHLDEFGDTRRACGGTLRLYDFPSFGPPMVALSPATGWKNLSTVGFDNRTESYRVGPCDARFADPAGGSPPLYPANLTKANMSSATMSSGLVSTMSSTDQW